MIYEELINYQEIISVVTEFMKVALPIGIIFGLTKKLTNLFFSLAFGKDKVDL